MAGQAAGATINTIDDMHAWDHEAVMKMARAANCLKAAAATKHGKLWISPCRNNYISVLNAHTIFIRAPQEVLGDCEEWADLMLLFGTCPVECVFHWALCKDLGALQQQQQCTIFCNDVASKLESIRNLRLDRSSGRLVRYNVGIHMALINYGIEADLHESLSMDLRIRCADACRHHLKDAVQNAKEKALAFCMGAHGRLGEASPLKQLAPEIVKAIFDERWT